MLGFHDILPLLERRGVCLPAFDCGGGQVEFVRGILSACEAARAAAMLLVYAPAGSEASLEACAHVVGYHADRASVPVVLHLDHAREEALLRKALAVGIKSVMFDGSALPLEENIRRTRAMADAAHACGATIEGELGRIGAELGDGIGTHALTDPDEAGRFVAETGVDLLAPAVGNAHGFYKAPPALQFDLIERIAARARVPLSLHGGTGIPMADVRRAASLGFRKMNVATGLHKGFADALRAAVADQADQARLSWRKVLDAGRDAVAAMAGQYLRELGAEGLL